MCLQPPPSSQLSLVTGSASIFGAQQPASITSLLGLCHGGVNTLIVTRMRDVSQHLSDRLRLVLLEATCPSFRLFAVPPLLRLHWHAGHSALCGLSQLDFHYFRNIMSLINACLDLHSPHYRAFIAIVSAIASRPFTE